MLAVGVAGAIAAVGLLSANTARSNDSAFAGSADSAPSAAATVVPAAPSPTPSPTPSEAEEQLQRAAQSIDPSDAPRQLMPTAPPDVTLGVTAAVAAGPEANRVGALFTGAAGPGNHVCTASVIDSPGRDLILTAAHCLDTADGVTFAPGYRDGQTPYGSWQVTKIYTADGWRSGSDPDEDFAILRVAPQGGRRIEDVVGGNPLGTDASWTAQTRLYGYPAGTEAPILCTNATARQDTFQRRIDCPSFPGGTSGGPFVDTATGKVVGVIGGYQQGGDTDDTSYSAYFDHTVADLLKQAAGG